MMLEFRLRLICLGLCMASVFGSSMIDPGYGLPQEYEALQNILRSVNRNTDGLKRTIRELTRQRDVLEKLLATCAQPSHETTVQPIITTATSTTTKPKYCPKDTMFIRSDLPCLYISVDRMNFAQAIYICSLKGGNLASGSKLAEYVSKLDDLYGEYGTRSRWPYWVGATQSQSGAWVWVDPKSDPMSKFDLTPESMTTMGNDVDPIFWAVNQPNDSSQGGPFKSCMLLDGFQAYKAVVLGCDQLRRFICEIPRQ